MLDAVALFVELPQSRVHSLAAEFRNLDALDDRAPAVFAGRRVAVDHAFRDAVAAVGGDAHRHPVALARAADPVAHVVDGRVGRRGQPARVDDRGAALLDGGNEGLLEPALVVDHRPDLLAVGFGLEDVRVLGRRVVSPDGDFSNRADGLRHLVRCLRHGPVMVEAHHAGELRRLQARRIFHRDEAIGVRRVADDQNFHVPLGDLVERAGARRPAARCRHRGTRPPARRRRTCPGAGERRSRQAPSSRPSAPSAPSRPGSRASAGSSAGPSPASRPRRCETAASSRSGRRRRSRRRVRGLWACMLRRRVAERWYRSDPGGVIALQRYNYKTPMANAALKRRRPKYLSLAALLFQIRLPLPGKVSILHRISGALLVFPLAAWLLYLLDQSLVSEEGFNRIKDHYLQSPLAKAGLLVFIWAYCHHFCAGIRFLLLDINQGVELQAARRSAALVLVVSLALTAYFGYRLW